jgi:hypothetical protein
MYAYKAVMEPRRNRVDLLSRLGARVVLYADILNEIVEQ